MVELWLASFHCLRVSTGFLRILPCFVALALPQNLTPSQHVLSPRDALTVSFSRPKTFDVEGLTFLLLDSTNDGETNYDMLVVPAPDGSVRVCARVGEWFALSERRDVGAETGVLFGRWSKVLALTPDLSAVALYLGHSAVTSTFGAAGSLAVLLIWLYVAAAIVLLCAVVLRAMSPDAVPPPPAA